MLDCINIQSWWKKRRKGGCCSLSRQFVYRQISQDSVQKILHKLAVSVEWVAPRFWNCLHRAVSGSSNPAALAQFPDAHCTSEVQNMLGTRTFPARSEDVVPGKGQNPAPNNSASSSSLCSESPPCWVPCCASDATGLYRRKNSVRELGK